LTNVVLEDGTTALSWNTDFSNSPIESLYLGRNISYNSLFDPPFRDKPSLKSLTIGNTVTSIGGYAFGGCSGLTDTLTIPNSVTSIGYAAFYNCSNLTGITIPNSVRSIGDYAFDMCSSLTEITIPNSVVSIGYAVFSGCINLKSFTIPNSVSSIGDYAFSRCSKLMKINCENPTPPQVQSNTFVEVDKKTCVLYVPAGCASIYASQPVWKDFFNIQEPTSINNIVFDSDISASITSEGIKITGCNPTDKVSIYAVNGQLVYSSVIGNGLISCPLQKGIYIIHTPKKSLKIIY